MGVSVRTDKLCVVWCGVVCCDQRWLREKKEEKTGITERDREKESANRRPTRRGKNVHFR